MMARGDRIRGDSTAPWNRFGDMSSRARAPVDPAEAERRRMGRLKSVFKAFDWNASGTVDIAELLEVGKARRTLGQKKTTWDEEKNRQYLMRMDTDGTGEVVLLFFPVDRKRDCSVPQVDETEFVSHFNRILPQDKDDFDAIIQEYMAAAAIVERRARQVLTDNSLLPSFLSVASSTVHVCLIRLFVYATHRRCFRGTKVLHSPHAP